MPLQLTDHIAILAGNISVEDAEPLANWLRQTNDRAVDLGACTHLHTAALQALASARARIAVTPGDAFLAKWIVPLLTPTPDSTQTGSA
ncbi:MAG: hypothetical protein ABSG43_12620 [Solirubrobacteraceae bacterium]